MLNGIANAMMATYTPACVPKVSMYPTLVTQGTTPYRKPKATMFCDHPSVKVSKDRKVRWTYLEPIHK